jgi:ketosteroid isomerase-like protein
MVENLHEKRIEQFVMMYAPNASFIGGGKRFTGRPSIHEITKSVMELFVSEIELRSIKVEFSGDLAYDSGEYRETQTTLSDGSKISIRGDYLTIYERSAGKKWMIVQQIWTEVSTPAQKSATMIFRSKSRECQAGRTSSS